MIFELPSNVVVVSDLDDTLYAERDFVLSGYLAVAKVAGVEDPRHLCDWMMRRYDEGREVLSAALEKAKRESGIDQLGLTDALEIYREHSPDITLRPDARRFLDLVMGANIPVGLITDGRSRTQRNKLCKLGLVDKFDPICISEEVGVAKPALQSFLQVEDRFPGRSYVYIGDNPKKDFIAPNKLGWESVCLLDSGENVHTQNFKGLSTSESPRYIVSTLDELALERG